MFDNDTELLVAIFQEAYRPTVNDELDPVKYVQRYKRQIEFAGQLFEYLQLAKPDTQSPLGWRPTDRLLKVIAKRAARRSKPIDRMVNAEEDLISELMFDAVFGELTDHSVTALGFRVLSGLGLMRETTDGNSLPSLELRELFADGYYARRERLANR
jgi:hypothetical protein